MKKEKPTM